MFKPRGRFDPVALTLSQTIWCPVHRTYVRAECRVAAWDSRLLDVERCAADDLATDGVCDKACLVRGREWS